MRSWKGIFFRFLLTLKKASAMARPWLTAELSQFKKKYVFMSKKHGHIFPLPSYFCFIVFFPLFLPLCYWCQDKKRGDLLWKNMCAKGNSEQISLASSQKMYCLPTFLDAFIDTFINVFYETRIFLKKLTRP